jgi:phytoene dehydrogenase-like protein
MRLNLRLSSSTIVKAAHLRRLSNQNEVSHPTGHLCLSVNRLHSTRVEHRRASRPPGLTATFRTEARKTIPNRSSGRIARFAPDFRDCILSRSVSSPAALELWNPNLIGGDFLGGAMDIRQFLFRATRSLYRTPRRNLYLCGASTPPGGGVHGMSGYHAAMTALRDPTR